MYLQSHIYKNIPVSFNFITTWIQGVFCVHPVLCANFHCEKNQMLLLTFKNRASYI